MIRFIQAVVIVLAIPMVAMVAIGTANDRLDSDWRGVLVEQFGPQSDSILDSLRLTVVCNDPEVQADIPESCRLSWIATVLAPAGLVAIGLSLGTLAALLPIQAFAKRDRRVLALFRPALLVLLILLTVIVVIDGALVAAAAYLVESAFTGGPSIRRVWDRGRRGRSSQRRTSRGDRYGPAQTDGSEGHRPRSIS